MQFSTVTLSFAALAAAGLALAQSTLTVNTPVTLITCQPAALTWTGGTAPYFPRVTVGGDVAQTLVSFDSTSATSLTWTVNIAAGTSVTIAVSDSTGASNGSAEVVIAPGSTSCLGSSTGGSSSTSSSSAPGSTSSSRDTPSSTSSRPTSSAPGTSSTTSSSGPTSSAPANGAEAVRGYSAAVAGVVGVVAAALL